MYEPASDDIDGIKEVIFHPMIEFKYRVFPSFSQNFSITEKTSCTDIKDCLMNEGDVIALVKNFR